MLFSYINQYKKYIIILYIVMLSRPLRIFIENELENIIINNDRVSRSPPKTQGVCKKPESVVAFSYTKFDKTKKISSLKKDELCDILRAYKSSVSFVRGEFYTRPEIKNVKASYDFSLSGKKEDLVRKVEKMFLREKIAIFMQKLIRGSYTRKLMALCGPGLRNRSICVNDTDFYTLEPISEITIDNFFSYTGSGDFVYGFAISSLLDLIKNSRKLQNPYNRETMERQVNDIYYVSRLSKLVYPKKCSKKVNEQTPSTLQYSLNNQSLSRLESVINVNNINQYNPTLVIGRLNESRSLPVSDRIRNVFMEIDQLGFYTQSSWFESLTRHSYVRFFSGLFDIWNYRAQMSFETKRKICPLRDPFIKIITGTVHYSLLSESQLKLMSLEVIEDMIFTGIDADSKALGAFHVLSALTLVSVQARNDLPWLYESLVF